jgi:hypothetical protein
LNKRPRQVQYKGEKSTMILNSSRETSTQIKTHKKMDLKRQSILLSKFQKVEANMKLKREKKRKK